MKKWVVSEFSMENADRIMNEYNIPKLPAAILDSKHFKNDDEMLEFISKDSKLTDPFLIKDMEIAVERINRAIDNFEKICIYGDYDADGVTSTAILYSYLESLSAYVMYYIPDRLSEGYGLNKNAIDLLKEKGVDLIITVDNGISAYNEIEYANSIGIDVVVTDHHTPPENLPNAIANVDPHRKDDESPFKYFCGAGVVLKLIMAMESENLTEEDILDLYSDICAIGTIGDVVSLTGENRVIVREGLKRLNENIHPGIEVLRERLGYENKYVTSEMVAFYFVPKINSVGRMTNAEKAVKLFLTDDYDEALNIVDEMLDNNRLRTETESKITAEVISAIESNPNIKMQKILVVEGENWHPGVIGIVAARIKDIYGKPTMLISCSGDNARGSGRSIDGFSMCDGITYCKDLLTIFGGHPAAAGWSLPTKNIPAFRDKINEYADSLSNTFFPEVNIVCKLNPATVSLDKAQSLALYLEPYGTDNPTPLFGFYNVTLCGTLSMSRGTHLKVFVSRNCPEIQVLFFKTRPEDFPYVKGDLLNIAATLETNEYNNKTELSIYGKDICFANVDYEALLKSRQIFEEFMLGKPMTDEMKNELLVTRDDFVVVYKFLRNNGGFKFAPDILHYRINNNKINYGKLVLILEVMKELNLITMNPTNSKLNIEVVKNPPKVDILSAKVLKGLGTVRK